MIGVIIAGGRGSRLGPLSLQSKCLLPAGSKPILIHQVQQLKALGCDDIRLVTSESHLFQISTLLGNLDLHDVNVFIQRSPRGPCDAIRIALSAGCDVDDEVVLFLADTYVADVDLPWQPDTVAVAAPPAKRQWCVIDQNGRWVDQTTEYLPVAVGLYRFGSATRLLAEATTYANRPQLAPILNAYPRLNTYVVRTWQDLGDAAALARTNRGKLICRSFNDLQVQRGRLVKRGNVEGERQFLRNPPPGAEHLFPRVFNDGPDWYEMEYFELPTLAELWLYRPGGAQFWEHVLRILLHSLRDELWGQPEAPADGETRIQQMYRTQLFSRYEANPPAAFHTKRPRLNSEELLGGWDLLEELSAAVIQDTQNITWGTLHGDPNFTNVLWGVNTSTFKLVDPRGSWGGLGPVGDVNYDAAKVMYSPSFSAVAHGLYDIRGEGYRWDLNIWPQRDHPTQASMGNVLKEMGFSLPTLNRLVALLLLAGAPLHEEPEASALYLLGARRADDCLG